MNRPALLILLLSILVASFAEATNFRTISTAQGLDCRVVREVRQDSAGFVWVCTHEGVDRFDGSHAKHYSLRHSSGLDEILDPFSTLCIDPSGSAWVVLKSGHIYRYDRLSDHFAHMADLPDAPPVYRGTFDADRRLWLATGSGVYSWHEDEGLLKHGLDGVWVKDILLSGGALIAGTEKGVFSATMPDGDKQAEFRQLFDAPLNTEAVCVTPSGIFAGTTNDGLWVSGRNGGNARKVAGVADKPVRAIALSPHGYLLAGVDGAGVYAIDPISASVTAHYNADSDMPGSISANNVSDLLIDRDGGVWVATSTRGLNYTPAFGNGIELFVHQPFNPQSLPSGTVNTVLEDADGDYWFGTNRGVSLFNTKTRSWRHFLGSNGDNAVVSIALNQAPDGRIWVGSYGKGVYIIDKADGNVSRLPAYNPASQKGMPFDEVYCIHNRDGKILLAGNGAKIVAYDPAADSYSYFPGRYIDGMADAPDGGLWIAANDALAFTRNPAAIDSWTNTIGGHTFRYPVIGICVDRDGSLWIATDGEGLAVYDPQADKTRIVTDGMGIDSNSILNVTADLQGRIWFSTERSVYCYDTAKNAVMCLNDLIPMSPEAFTQCSSTLLSDGDVMFGSIDGAVKCTGPDNLSLSFSPQPVFTDFEMMNTLLRPGAGNDIITRNIDDTEKITLAHDQNSFSISYSAVNMAYPRRIRFEHMLENFDKEWISADLPGWVKYTNLSPGNYKFRVRAIDRWTGSITGEREIDVAIRRSPWLSGWALLIYAAVAAGIIYILLQNFRHRINERRFNDRFRTVVSLAHDIKTPVSLIKAPLSEVLESNQLSDANRHNILLASQNADKLHSIITQLMEIQRSDEGDKPTARFAMCDIAKHLSGKIEEYRMLASQKGIGMEFDTHIQDFPTPQPPNSPTPISVLTDTEKLDHIIDNLLTNAVKYTARGSVTATLSISPRQWSVEISDTGIGIPASEQKRIFTEHYRASNAVNSKESGSGIGLMIVHRLVQQLGGAISFKSTEGVGSTFTLVFPTRINVRPDTEPAPDKSAPDISSAEADDQTNTLLIAEDDADLNAYLVKAFSDEYKVVSVPDGGKAYSTAVEINPDLVLTDLRMPVMGGDELCRRLKSSIETSHIPVILVTALSEREDIINGLEAGANDYIVKPFDMTMLKLRVRNIINGRRKLRETLVSSSGEVPDNDFTGTLDREFLDKVKEILDREMANSEYSINDFCREVGMSRTSFYNKIKVLTGTSPNDYIRIVRLNRARDLLSTRQYNVSEVSFMVGFSDPKYFSVCFKKQFGTSPSKI